jgi:polyadenylate-binding protein 2
MRSFSQTDAAVENAVKLDGSEFKGRNLKVIPKRVNVAGYNQQQMYEQGGGRGVRGGRGLRGGGRGYRGGYRGRGSRGRGRGGYHPYY